MTFEQYKAKIVSTYRYGEISNAIKHGAYENPVKLVNDMGIFLFTYNDTEGDVPYETRKQLVMLRDYGTLAFE